MVRHYRQLVRLYRDGKLVQTTPNDGRHITEAGSTAVCSPERFITLSN